MTMFRVWAPEATQVEVEGGGYGIDAQWSDDFHHALHTVLTGERGGYYADFGPLADLAKALERVFVYDGRYSVCRRRQHGRPPLGSPDIGFWAICKITIRSATGRRESVAVI